MDCYNLRHPEMEHHSYVSQPEGEAFKKKYHHSLSLDRVRVLLLDRQTRCERNLRIVKT